MWGELQDKDANYIPDLLLFFFCTQGCSSTEGVSRHHNAANTIGNHWSLGVTMRGPLFPSDENFLEYIFYFFSVTVIVPHRAKNVHLRSPQQGWKEVALSHILVESKPCCKPCSLKPCAHWLSRRPLASMTTMQYLRKLDRDKHHLLALSSSISLNLALSLALSGAHQPRSSSLAGYDAV